jgi:hypothetical protein
MEEFSYVNPDFFERNLDSEDPQELKFTAKKQLDIVVNLLIKLTDKKIMLEKFLIG